jgi:pSer/pThr/pTyr-binding forkhead associated (FHA) protein
MAVRENVIALTVDNPCVSPSTSVIFLEQGTALTIGRGSSSEVTIPNPYISRAHIRISWMEESVLVHDLESTNGTRVNDLRVVGSKPIRFGDKISICDVTLIVKPINDPEVIELKAKGSELNASIAADADIQSKLINQHKARKKTRTIRPGDIRPAAMGVSRAETLSFERPKRSRRNASVTFAFIVIAILSAWLLLHT